jgi:hypothetical protein
MYQVTFQKMIQPFGILFKYCGCLDSIDIGRSKSMKIRSGGSASALAMASLLLQAFIASYPKICYAQTQDLKRVLVIFHKKNFLVHPLKLASVVLAWLCLRKYSVSPCSMPRLFRRRATLAMKVRMSKRPITTEENNDQIEIFCAHCPTSR